MRGRRPASQPLQARRLPEGCVASPAVRPGTPRPTGGRTVSERAEVAEAQPERGAVGRSSERFAMRDPRHTGGSRSATAKAPSRPPDQTADFPLLPFVVEEQVNIKGGGFVRRLW
jgi:hypothetical protein